VIHHATINNLLTLLRQATGRVREGDGGEILLKYDGGGGG
jgi:hypothetical protein